MHDLYMTVEDIVRLKKLSPDKAARHHRFVRRKLTRNSGEYGEHTIKPTLTIREYCLYMQEPYEEIYAALREIPQK